jgi:DNA polymerase III gamma/tau subunit
MNPGIAIHISTQHQLDKYLELPAHAVILLGANGTGKSVIARVIAEKILADPYERAINQGSLLIAEVEENKLEISIDAIRKIIRQLSKKAPGKRVVLIENAGLMSDEAQNAILKTLEQPGVDIYFIMTASSQSVVLATISSRAVILRVRPVSLEQAKNHYNGKFSETEIEKAWQLSEGNASTLDALLKGEKNDIVEMIEQAKEFLRVKPYERLLQLDNLAKDRQQLRLFLEALQRVIKAVHHSTIKSQRNSSKRLLDARKTINEILEKLETNTSPKLLALELVANLTV